jgi:hypothetical protein
MPAGTPRIALIYIDSGGGHRAAAEALQEVIRAQGHSWDVQMISIQDLLCSIDYIRKYTGIAFQDVYNIMLRRGWTVGSAQIIPVMHRLIRRSHNSQVAVLEESWRGFQPDLVVSLIPHFNRAMKEALTRVSPDVPFVTLLTDIADYPPHFWLERQDQFVICGSQRAARQAADIGLPAEDPGRFECAGSGSRSGSRFDHRSRDEGDRGRGHPSTTDRAGIPRRSTNAETLICGEDPADQIFCRRLEELEAGSTDGSRLVPHSRNLEMIKRPNNQSKNGTENIYKITSNEAR